MTHRHRSTLAAGGARGLAGLAAVAFAAMVHAACSTQAAGVTCSPGQTVTCSCEGALTGQAACDSTGHEGACNCAGTGSSSGSSSGSSGSSSGSSADSGPAGGEAGLPVESGVTGGDGAVGDGATGG